MKAIRFSRRAFCRNLSEWIFSSRDKQRDEPHAKLFYKRKMAMLLRGGAQNAQQRALQNAESIASPNLQGLSRDDGHKT